MQSMIEVNGRENFGGKARAADLIEIALIRAVNNLAPK